MTRPRHALELRGLSVTYPRAGGPVEAVRDVSLRVAAGEVVGLAGESGSGKTSLVRAVLRLLPPGTATAGQVLLDGADVTAMSWGRLRAVRWAVASIVFQGALDALNPRQTVGAQIAEPIRLHARASRRAARDAVAALLAEVGLAADLARRYPHQLSGGQRQRVLVAMALACEPRLLIADEPTTALDADARATTAALLRRLAATRDTGLLLVSHDLGLLVPACDRLAVMQAGRVVEEGPAARVAGRPAHPHTAALVEAAAAFGAAGSRRAPAGVAPGAAPLLRARDLTVTAGGRARRRAGGDRPLLDAAGVDVAAGEVLAVVGEVGAGKTTLARALAGLVRPERGDVRLAGRELRYGDGDLHRHRRLVQYVPQEAVGALDPRRTVGHAVAEGPRVHGVPPDDVAARVAAALADVLLLPAERFTPLLPRQLSAGQQQRVVLAAALAVRPAVLVADEPLASLDAVSRAHVLALLRDRAAAGTAVVLVIHDLAAAWQVAHRVAVVHGGRVVETGPAERVLTSPAHPATRRLVAAQAAQTARAAGAVRAAAAGGGARAIEVRLKGLGAAGPAH